MFAVLGGMMQMEGCFLGFIELKTMGMNRLKLKMFTSG